VTGTATEARIVAPTTGVDNDKGHADWHHLNFFNSPEGDRPPEHFL
jgi:hypothetical protein